MTDDDDNAAKLALRDHADCPAVTGANVAKVARMRKPLVTVDYESTENGTQLSLSKESQAGVWEAFGTSSRHFIDSALASLGRLTTATGRPGAAGSDLNAALAVVAGISPSSEVEAMLAIQMYATHEAAMAMLTRVHTGAGEQSVSAANLATKLSRTYVAQIEALGRLRRGGEQTVRVEHVHVHAGGQAIVGNVATGGGGTMKLEGQFHEQHTEGLGVATLLGIDATGGAMPGTGDEERQVPRPRRKSGRTARQS